MNVDVARVNNDLRLLLARIPDGYAAGRTERRVFTLDTRFGKAILLRGLPLAPHFRPAAADLLLPLPKNLYDPLPDGRFGFYQYAYPQDGLHMFHPRTRRELRIPRYMPIERASWYPGYRFLCVTPQPPWAGRETTVLDFLLTVQAFLVNAWRDGEARPL